MPDLTPRSPLRERVAVGIVEAAAEVLARHERASMAEVSEAAGVARATLYRYYPTREVLLETLWQVGLEDAGGRLEAAGLDRVPVAEAFTRAVRGLVAVGDSFVVLVRARAGPTGPDFERGVAGPLGRLIERGQAAGEIREDVSALWLLESLLALVVTVLPSAPALGPDETVEAIASLFLDGARGPRSTVPA
jgi:TetR/AcrR family transcriptional regulator, mexCD-oprJ operon repressor